MSLWDFAPRDLAIDGCTPLVVKWCHELDVVIIIWSDGDGVAVGARRRCPPRERTP